MQALVLTINSAPLKLFSPGTMSLMDSLPNLIPHSHTPIFCVSITKLYTFDPMMVCCYQHICSISQLPLSPKINLSCTQPTMPRVITTITLLISPIRLMTLTPSLFLSMPVTHGMVILYYTKMSQALAHWFAEPALTIHQFLRCQVTSNSA